MRLEGHNKISSHFHLNSIWYVTSQSIQLFTGGVTLLEIICKNSNTESKRNKTYCKLKCND